ncbi:MAG: hypothetical protein RL272_559 [Candidatus Parcubacteria bacterium]|jgi:hypothetical protein
MTAATSLVPVWAYVAATALLPFWFRFVITVAEDPAAFYSRCRAGSLLHGAVWMMVLLDRGFTGAAMEAVFGINMFGTLFYVMCMRRDGVADD